MGRHRSWLQWWLAGWAEEERRKEDNPSEGDSGKKKKKDDDEPEDDSPNHSGHHSGLCFKCRNEITDLCATIDRCHDQLVAMDRRMNDIECLAKKDYNFLLRNIRKLFRMVGDVRKQGGGGRPRCNCPRCRWEHRRASHLSFISLRRGRRII